MNKQTLYIILIIGLFNFLLINIFRLQKEIIDLRNKKNSITGLNNNYTELDKKYEGTRAKINEKMNEIAELVPIDFNKIVDSKEKFIPKEKQV